MKKLVLAAALCVAAIGCGDDDENNSNSANNATPAWEAGAYTITVEDVQDNCFDGAMNTVVLPDGTARDLPSGVTLPGPDGLPANVDIEFTAPFESVTGVAVEASGANGLTTSGTGFAQTGVDIDGDAGDCVADMNVSFTLTSSGDGRLTGTGELSITAATGDDCPAFQEGPPCTVVSNLTAVKN